MIFLSVTYYILIVSTTISAPQTPPARRRIVRVGIQYTLDTLVADRRREEARQRICLPAAQIWYVDGTSLCP